MHEPVLDNDGIKRDDWQLDVAAVAFAHDDCHVVTVDCRPQDWAEVFVLDFNDVVASTRSGHRRKRGFPARIGRLIARGSVGPVVDYQQRVIARGVVGDGG